jgi:hypothetical protein
MTSHRRRDNRRRRRLLCVGYCSPDCCDDRVDRCVNRTVLMVRLRGAIQHACDHGSPIIVVVWDSAGDESYCGSSATEAHPLRR